MKYPFLFILSFIFVTNVLADIECDDHEIEEITNTLYLEYGPEVVNVDSDPELEFIILQQGKVFIGEEESTAKVLIYNDSGTFLDELNVEDNLLDNYEAHLSYYTLVAQPTVADLDGNGINEIIVVASRTKWFINDRNNNPLNRCWFQIHGLSPFECCERINQTMIWEWSDDQNEFVFKTSLLSIGPTYGVYIPTCFDLDQDGDMEIFGVSQTGFFGNSATYLYVLDYDGDELTKIVNESLDDPWDANDEFDYPRFPFLTYDDVNTLRQERAIIPIAVT